MAMAIAWFSAKDGNGIYKIAIEDGKPAVHSALFPVIARNANEADYLTLIRLLSDSCLLEGATVLTANKLLVKQLEGGLKASPQLKQAKQRARKLMKQKRVKLVLMPRDEIVVQLGG